MGNGRQAWVATRLIPHCAPRRSRPIIQPSSIAVGVFELNISVNGCCLSCKSDKRVGRVQLRHKSSVPWFWRTLHTIVLFKGQFAPRLRLRDFNPINAFGLSSTVHSLPSKNILQYIARSKYPVDLIEPCLTGPRYSNVNYPMETPSTRKKTSGSTGFGSQPR